MTGAADAVVFDEQHAIHAFDAQDAFEGGVYVINRLDEIAGLGGGGVGRADRGQGVVTGEAL